MKTLYFDCSAGIAGDMCVAALLDLGANHQAMTEGLHSLGVEACELGVHRVRRSGVDACGFDVRLTEPASPIPPPILSAPPPQPMGEGMFHFIDLDGAPEPRREPMHIGQSFFTLPEDPPVSVQRDMGDIREIIASSGISPRAKDWALRVFELAAKAEGKVRNLSPDAVVFGEADAILNLVDIVGTAILIDSLQVDRILCSSLSEGQGVAGKTVPSPAVLEIVRERGIPLRLTEEEGERITLTGASIVGALAERFGLPAEGKVLGVGYGAGTRSASAPGVLRAILIREEAPEEIAPPPPEEQSIPSYPEEELPTVCELSCNLDDIAGELLAFACEELRNAGALNVWTVSADCREGPGHILTLLCRPEEERDFIALLLRHTTAERVRSCHKRQTVSAETRHTVETPYGSVSVRESLLDGYHKIKVDFASAKKVARERNLPINQVLSAAYTALGKKYEGPGRE